jgi:hypothetical protein
MQTIITGAILGVVLTGVLSYVRHQNNLIMRSQNWNSAFAAAEAGIEEAMSHLTATGGGSRNSNGWASVTGGFIKTNFITGDLRFVTFMTSAGAPTITSTGYSRLNFTGADLTRVIRVTTRSRGDFIRALTARGKITLSGQFQTDSFDSSDPNYSTGGQYDPAKRKANGDVGSMLAGDLAFDMGGEVKVYGTMSTTPTGTYKVDSQAAVGDIAFINANKYGVQGGHHKNDLNVSFPPKIIPTGGLVLPGGATIAGVNYARVFTSGKFFTSTVSLSGSTQWLINGDVELIVDKDWSQSGSAQVVIAPGANLKLYVKEGSISVSGNGFLNPQGNAASLQIIGRSHTYSGGSIAQKGLENINLSGNSLMIATIYAPDAKLSLSGSGNDWVDLVGAAVVGEINGSGSYRYHYDEALGSTLGSTAPTIASWREL